MIVVFVETVDGEVEETSLETLTFARSLSDEGGGVPIDALVVGESTPAVSATLGRYAVRRLLRAEGESFFAYAPAAWAKAMLAAREQSRAVVLMAAGTPRGMEIAAHAAARLEVPMAANVISFEGLAPFEVTRQVVGGAAWEKMRLGHRPAIFTVAGHAVEAKEAQDSGTPQEVSLDVEVTQDDLVARVSRTEPGEGDQSGSLKSARLVVGAGRGAGGPDGFGAVDELARLLHAQVGVSRVVTSLGWRPHHEQVGQTGSRISPELYIPCGISGAIQHWAGMSSSKRILAVNTDAEAPMVTKADYAVVGDMHEVLPAVIEEIRRRQGTAES